MVVARVLLDRATHTLGAAGVPSPRVDAEMLLAHATGLPRLALRLSGSQVGPVQSERFEQLVGRRATREPLQHITGRAAFRHLDLRIGPGTFIPRPETELLVDEVLRFLAPTPRRGSPALAHARPGSPGLPDAQRERGSDDAWSPPVGAPLVVDLCSGSGALALAVATECPGVAVAAVELSGAAIRCARRNVAELAAPLATAGSTVHLLHHDATRVAGQSDPLAHLAGRVDVVVTNPPYVPDAAVPREPEVREHEPALALYGGPDGLDVVRRLVSQAALLLRAGGLLLIEHADVQGEAAAGGGVPGLLRSWPSAAPRGGQGERPDDPDARRVPQWRDVHDHDDLTGQPRFTRAVRIGTMAR